MPSADGTGADVAAPVAASTRTGAVTSLRLESEQY